MLAVEDHAESWTVRFGFPPEIARYLRGDLTRDQALEAGRIATRQYAKRQYTWFRRQPPAEWPRFEAPLDRDTMPAALALLGA